MVKAWGGKTAIVTGAARGIGAAVARAGIAEGGVVWLLDVDAERGTALAADLGPAAHFAEVDLTRDDDVRSAIGRLAEKTDRIDVLVNCASRDSSASATSLSDDEWDLCMALDLRAPWVASRAVLPRMIEQGSGAIVNIGSIHALMTAEQAFPYGSAKAGLAAMTRSMALDFGKHGIRANTVTPGWTLSERVQADFDQLDDAGREHIIRSHALRRLGRPEEIANVVVFVASDAAAFVTGANWLVDGGLSARFA